MKQLIVVLLFAGISINLFADADIVVGQPASTGKKIKTILTSRPAQVIYGLLGLGLGGGICWLVYRHQQRESQELCYQQGQRNELKKQAMQNNVELQSGTGASPIANLSGVQLEELFKKNGTEIKNYFFGDTKHVVYTSGVKYQHNFMIRGLSKYDEAFSQYAMQMRNLYNALNSYNIHRRQWKQNEIVINALISSDDIIIVNFNPPID